MMPPEAFKSDSFDVTFDVYQFGLTLYRMCVGNNAFYKLLEAYGPKIAKRDDFRFDVNNGRFPDRKAYPAHIPTKLRNIVAKCLSVAPSDRYQSAIEVSNALAGVDDKSFDWRLSEADGIREWVKNENGTQLRFAINLDQSCSLYKSVDGGTPRRVGDGCRTTISEKEAQKLLGSY